MAKQFDATPKFLLELGPADWLALIGRPTTAPVSVVESELSTVTSQADKILRVDEPNPWLAHFEPFSSRDEKAPLRMCRYSILIEEKFDLPVWTAVILLRREADSPELNGIFRRFLPDGTCYDEFRYQVIRVWKLPAEILLSGGISTLPLAPISNVKRSELPALIRRMRERVEAEVPKSDQNEFWAATSILLGSRYEGSVVKQLMQGITNMRESSVVQEFLEEGRCEEARGMVRRVYLEHLGMPDQRILDYLESLNDVPTIEAFARRALKAKSWDDLLPRE